MTKERVLLIHSGGFTSRQWRRLAEALAPTYDVLAPDLIGYGTSGPWPDGEPFHFRQDLEALEALIDAHPAPVHVIGHSYGGLLALQLALSRPAKVRSVGVFEPVAFGILDDTDAALRGTLEGVKARYEPGPGGADEDWLGTFVDWWNGPGAWAGLPEDTRSSFRSVGWKLSQEVFSLMADRTDAATYGTIAAPTLLLGGGLSQPVERRVLEKLEAALPHARCEIFPGMGHMGPITHAPVVNAAFIAHVKEAG